MWTKEAEKHRGGQVMIPAVYLWHLEYHKRHGGPTSRLKRVRPEDFPTSHLQFTTDSLTSWGQAAKCNINQPRKPMLAAHRCEINITDRSHERFTIWNQLFCLLSRVFTGSGILPELEHSNEVSWLSTKSRELKGKDPVAGESGG